MRGRGRRSEQDADFTAYASGAVRRLRRTAYLMCRDWHLAEDLTQTALTKVYLAWPRVSRAEDIDAYTRRVLLNSLLDHRRRRRSDEVVVGELPQAVERVARHDGAARADLRMTLIDALATLPPLDRAIVVLRYWDDCSIEQTAAILGTSTGTIKTRSKRALAKVRAALPDLTLSALL